MSTNTILASAPLTATGYHLKATGTTLGQSLIWDNGTNVGIGNTNTSYTLDVSGTGRFTGNTILASTSGNVGIGVTPSAWSAITALELANGVSFGSYTATAIPNMYATSNAYYNGTNWIYKLSSYASTLYAQNSNGQFDWNTAPAGTAGNPITFSLAMRITQAGNVGIGTSSPNVSGQGIDQRVLTIQGVGGVWGGVEVSVTGNTSAGALNGFYGFTNAGLSAGYKLVSYIGSWLDGGGVTSGADMRFHTQANGAVNAIERMRITSAGNVGIGMTTPAAKLDLGANTGGAGTINKISLYNTGATPLYGFGISAAQLDYISDNNHVFYTAGSEKMRINTVGNVLIGQTTAFYVATNRTCLELNGSSSSILGINVGGAIAGYLYADSTDTYVSNSRATGRLYATSNSAGVYLTTGATAWTANSDERLKNIHSNIENAVESLMTLRTVKHSWKSDNTNKEHLGLIAQDVEKVFPQVIDIGKLPNSPSNPSEDETEYLGVRYTELIPVLIAAIKEQQIQIQNLQEQINILAK